MIDEAVNKGISVIALTDHHTVSNIDEIKKYAASKNIVVISGIEFRTEYGAKSVHMIGLFPEKYGNITLNQKELEELILSPLKLSRTAIVAKGKEEKPEANNDEAFKIGMFKVQVDFKDAADLIHRYGGLVSVHAGNKTNSIEEMKHEGRGTSNVKDVVDSLGTLKEELLTNYIDICEIGSASDRNADFYVKTYSKPVIAASDAHKTADVGKLFTWIKADKTFDGLRQIIYEPELRVKIQKNEPEIKSKYQVIEKVSFNHADFGNQEIPLNPGLNTIIGGRSSGKSILLGCIAKLADYTGKVKGDNEDYETYLEDVTASMSILWADGSRERGRKVEYFPQSYINGLAAKAENTAKLIENILKGDSNRRNCYESFERNLSKNNMEIASLLESYFNLRSVKKDLEDQLQSIGDPVGIENEISRLQKEVDELKINLTIKLSVEDEVQYISLKEDLEKRKNHITLLKTALSQLSELTNLHVMKDISADLISLPSNVNQRITAFYDELKRETGEKWLEIIKQVKDETSNCILYDENKIKEIESDNLYQKGETFYKENGAVDALNKRLDSEKKKAEYIKEKLKKCKEYDEKIITAQNAIMEKHASFYNIMTAVSEQVSMEKDDVSIVPVPQFASEKFSSFVDNNFNKRGQKVQALLGFVWQDATSFNEFIENVFEDIVNGRYTLKSSRDEKQVASELVSANYYKLIYDVKYQGDTLSSMSEGKKAFVILRMILDFDENECPILIDQPEDDLDNRAIYNDLVTYIRAKKAHRQMILVTHNPNVVVAADSEEIIVSNQDGINSKNQDDIKFEYRSGAMENTYEQDKTKSVLISQGIRQHVCDLLEGGDIAFKQRENKYGFSIK
ncbi:TrlF family AAA-like ATPase [Selenomonas ruminantium]|uniref:TrlF family AAA-like ATPase n=1 Tax=Selenomonas ruminantium TaxID=971 RepID=UPI00350E3692